MAPDGPAAIELAERLEPEIVVLDWMFPGLDGLQVIARLRRFSNAYVIVYKGSAGLKSDDAIAYCRIGERSSHTWFVLKYPLGYDGVRNYDGSWTEWGNTARTQIERQAERCGRAQRFGDGGAWKEYANACSLIRAIKQRDDVLVRDVI
nr:rhodanese-like domain-containing protein [Rubrobacter indicoceani]